ncbi:MAG: DUF1134 domain-containing protein [Deltaproteobacteria bacterium]|nr:DUF1134 domain-containing protein [Deltaproteobacteria bacterium]
MRRPTPTALLLLTIILFGLSASPLPAAKPLPPVGEVSIELKGVGAIFGVSWGHGVLWFKGKKYPFRVEGLSVGDVGYAEIKARGKVYNLKKPLDITGTYAAVGAGVALAGGVAGLAMQNERGVVIDLSATQSGVKLNLGPQGLTITMR